MIRACHSTLSAPGGASRCTLTFAPSACTRRTPPASGPAPSSMRTEPRRPSPDHAIFRTSAGKSTSSEGLARCEASTGIASRGECAGATVGVAGKKPMSNARRRSSGSRGSSAIARPSLAPAVAVAVMFVPVALGVGGVPGREIPALSVDFGSVWPCGVRRDTENGAVGRVPRATPAGFGGGGMCAFNWGIMRSCRATAGQSCASSREITKLAPSRGTLLESGVGSDTK